MTPEETARFLNGYARRHAAGAFATPLARELGPGNVRLWENPLGRTVAVTKRLTRDSVRTDWLGQPYTLPRGATIVTHLGRETGSPIPADLDEYHAIYAYADDLELTAGLARLGREVAATRISAASEMIHCWGWPGTARPTPLLDGLTVVPVATHSGDLLNACRRELGRATGWADDYPFYSDGSWSALSLRGFDPDPAWGVKPAEMGRKWNDAHPGALRRTCVWTDLADRCPTLVQIASQLPGAGLERVRLMRMKQGKLARHTDITDKASGLRDGQIARFHLPLITSELVALHVWELSGELHNWHLDEGVWYYLDARKPHAVTQGDPDLDRIHLVADVIVDESTRSYLEARCSAAT